MLRFIDGHRNINVLLSFVFGTLFVITLLAFAVFVPNPSPFAQWVFITVLALAAAGVGSVTPGMLEVDLPYIRAGGALALFAIVLLMKPVIINSVALMAPPDGTPDAAIQKYLNSVDSRDLSSAWDQLDPEAKIGVARDKDAYRQVYEASFLSLGGVKVRTVIGVQELQSPAGYPLGVYRSIAYQTRFSNNECRQENVTARGFTDRVWRVFLHNVSPQPMPCVKAD